MRPLISAIIAAWPMAAKRSLAHWRLLSTVVIGVLLSSTVMAGTVIYFDALRELALKNALDAVPDTDLDILLKAERGPTDPEEYQKVLDAAQTEFIGRLGWLFKDVRRSAKTATFYLSRPGNEEFAGNDDARSYFAFNPRLADHITILPGGRSPDERPIAAADAPVALEAIVPADAAERFGVGVGDALSAVPYWRDRIPYARVVISGVFVRNDPASEFWLADDALFRSITSGSFRTVPFYVSEQMFFNILGANFTDMDSSYAWHLDVDRERLNANNSTATAQQTRIMRSRLSTQLFGFRQITELDATLSEYDRRLFFSKIPMFVVMVLIAVVILYYVATLSSLLVEQQRGEVALLRSRGAGSGQILTVFILEGATISLAATLAAPPLAAAIISQLGYAPAFSGLSGGEPLGVFVTRNAYLMSALGGALSFASLLLPAIRASRIGATRHRQQSARPTEQPFYQRFYLDVMLLIVSIFLFRQLQDQGSVVATGLFGGAAVNQALLAAPALILVAFAVALLRLFPLSIRYISGDSPNLMHLIVGVAAGAQAIAVVFGGADGASGAWQSRALPLAAIALFAALYWATERAPSGKWRAAGLFAQFAAAAAIMLSPFTPPLLEFLAYDDGAVAATPAVIGGVLVVSASWGADGAFSPFIPLPLGVVFMAFSAYAKRAPVGFSMGMWQMARNPTHYARMSLLLILMAGLGIFAASFGGTLERSFQEQARYATGADIRVEGVTLNNRGRSVSLAAQYEGLPAVNEASPVIKAFGTDLSKLLGESYTMVGVDGEAMSRIGWFRGDFAEQPMARLLTMLEHPEPPVGVAMPDGATSLGIRVKPDRPRENLALSVRVKDANDRYFTYVMGRLGGGGDASEGWLEMERGLVRSSTFRRFSPLQPEHPLTLASLSVHDTNSRGRLRGGNIVIDEIWTRGPSNRRQPLEDFQSVAEWTVLRGARESITDILQPLNPNGGAQTPTDNAAARFIWSEGAPLVGRGIYHGPPANPLPVLASDRFLDETGHAVGEEFTVSVSGHRVPIRIIDEFEYFPTLDAFRKSYLISDLASVVRYANLEPTAAEVKPNEVWIAAAEANGSNGGDGDRAALLRTLRGEDAPFNSRQVHDRVEALQESAVDPLVDAGWRALLFMAFGAVLILSCLGFLVHSYVSFREREMQFGLMRTVGFSMRQLITLVWLEQALVIGAGMALGAEMGRRLGAIIMPFLSHNDRGAQVLPPFVLEIDWATLAVTYGFMMLVFTIIILGMIWFIRRISLQRILRLGEL